MNVVTHRFPLSRLPPKIKIHVVKSMNVAEIFSFSFISKATKACVLPMNLNISSIKIEVDASIVVTVMFGNHAVDYSFPNIENRATDSVEVTVRSLTPYIITGSYQWRNAGFTLRDWIRNLKTVAQLNVVKGIHFYRTGQLHDLASIARIVNRLNVDKLEIENQCPAAYFQSILSAIHTNSIILMRNPFPDHPTLLKFLLRNIDRLFVYFQTVFTLDDVLLMNSRCFSGFLTVETLNKFIKLCQSGYKPRLNRIIARFRAQPNPDALFEKIEFSTVVERNLRRPAHSDIFWNEPIAYDINGKDGMRGTVYVMNATPARCIEFAIWD
ncbi:unnamed protein product [Caenorhabditis brenneri]